jgi:hypothetical protein
MNSIDQLDKVSVSQFVTTLNKSKQRQMIARLAYKLTIYARDTYEPGSMGLTDPARLRGINEIMHQVTNRLISMAQGDVDDWEESLFWKILYEIAESYNCISDLKSAIRNATDSVATK